MKKILPILVITLAIVGFGAVAISATNDNALTRGSLENVPPWVEDKWELYDEDGTLSGMQVFYDNMPVEIFKCAAVCDDNSAGDISHVGATITHELSGTLVDDETLTPAVPEHCTGTFQCGNVTNMTQCDMIPGCSVGSCSGFPCCMGTPTVDCDWLHDNESSLLNVKCDGQASPEPDLPGCVFVPDDPCWQTVDSKDPEFRTKYEIDRCELYIGNFTFNPGWDQYPYLPIHPAGWYKVVITATDSKGQTDTMENELNYKEIGIGKPKVIKKWEISEIGTDPDGEVTPVPCDINTVIKCVVVQDPDGAADIGEIKITVTDPTGNVYDRENLSSGDLTRDTGVCANHSHANQTEVVDCIADGTCAIYIGTMDMQYNDTPGMYHVLVEAWDRGGIPAVPLENEFQYNQLCVFDLDTSTINFGTLIPGVTTDKFGDKNMSTTTVPTVKNCGNVRGDIDVTVDNMTCTNAGLCDADFIPNTAIDVRPGALAYVPDSSCFPGSNLMPAAMTNLDTRVNTPLSLRAGPYRGDITVMCKHPNC